MSLTLPSSVSSLQDVSGLEQEVRGYAKWFAHNEIKDRAHAANAAPPPAISPAAQELLRSWSSKTLLTPQRLDELLAALAAFKAAAPTMTITLAAPPPKSVKETLVAWCRQNIKPDMLVNFQFNSTLCGGMVVRIGSHVYDWSFRRQILEAKHTFPEVLRRV